MQQACQAAATIWTRRWPRASARISPTLTARKACRQAAAGAVKEARQSCKEQLAGAPGRLRRARAGALRSRDRSRPTSSARSTTPTSRSFPARPSSTRPRRRTASSTTSSPSPTTRKVILGVTCVEVHDTVTLDGELTRTRSTGSPRTPPATSGTSARTPSELEDGLVVSVEGSWTARHRRRQAGHRHGGRTRGRRLLPPGVLTRRRRGHRRRA